MSLLSCCSDLEVGELLNCHLQLGGTGISSRIDFHVSKQRSTETSLRSSFRRVYFSIVFTYTERFLTLSFFSSFSGKQVNFTVEQMRSIMDLKHNIRSMSVIAHVDHVS